MSKIEIAIYDDEPQDISSLIDWLRKHHPDCEVTNCKSAEELVTKIAQGYRPVIGVIDLGGQSDAADELDMIDAFDLAFAQGLDIMAQLDQELLIETKLENWLRLKIYGIGVLALLKAANCPIRMAHTQHSNEPLLVNMVLGGGLANAGLCPKQEMPARRRLERAIKEVRELLANQRAVPDIYDIAVLEDVDEDCDEGLMHRLRVRIGEKKN